MFPRQELETLREWIKVLFIKDKTLIQHSTTHCNRS